MFSSNKRNLGTLQQLDDSFIESLYGKEYVNRQSQHISNDEKDIDNKKKKLGQSKQTRLINIHYERWQKIQKLIIINPFSGKKSLWDVIVIIMVFYSCFTSYFWSSFWPEGFERYSYIETVIEIFFVMDIVINFLTSYIIDEETNELTYSIFMTSLNYIKKYCVYKKYFPTYIKINNNLYYLLFNTLLFIKSGFIFDLFAVFPFNLMFPETNLKLTRMIRIIRFFRVIDENKIVAMLNRLIDNINPKNKIQLQYTARYMYRIFRFILIGFSIAFYISCAWYIYCTSDWSDDNFKDKYYLKKNGAFKQAIISYYFILSTLATVGYGDFSPQSPQERIIAMIIMITGVAFFSYIINNFNDIMKNYYKKLGYINKTPEVEEWLLSLNMGSDRAMDKNLIKRIYDHFHYFYKHYRLMSFTKDDKYFRMMSYQDKRQMIRHLFQDIFSGKFRTFFLSNGKNEFPNYNFYVDIAFALLPRKCKDKQVILQQGEEVEEIYFLIDGEIEVSFTVDDLKIKKYFTSGFQFGSVQILSNSLSNFTYQTTTPVTLYAIKKQPFLQIFNSYPEIKQEIILNAFSAFRLTRKSMMEQFVFEAKDKLGVLLNEEEANYLFDMVNKKLQKSKKRIVKNNLKIFTNSLKINEEDLTDSDSDSQDDISINERLSDLQESVNKMNEKLNTIQKQKAPKQQQSFKGIFKSNR